MNKRTRHHKITHEPDIPMWSQDPEREARAGPRWCAESAGVECIAEQPEAAPQLATRTHSGTVITPQKPSLAGASYPS
jgi:hypothetical protein